MAFRVEANGIKEIFAKFSRFTRALKDWRPIWEEIIDDFHNIEKEQFDSEGARGPSGKWQALTPRYASWKTKNYPGRPILVLSGKTKTSLIQRNVEGALHQALPNRLTLGTMNSIAKYANLKRKMIDLKGEDKTRWAKIVHSVTFKILAKIGLR